MEGVVGDCKATLLVLDRRGLVLQRLWPLFEIWLTAKLHGANKLQVRAQGSGGRGAGGGGTAHVQAWRSGFRVQGVGGRGGGRTNKHKIAAQGSGCVCGGEGAYASMRSGLRVEGSRVEGSRVQGRRSLAHR